MWFYINYASLNQSFIFYILNFLDQSAISRNMAKNLWLRFIYIYNSFIKLEHFCRCSNHSHYFRCNCNSVGDSRQYSAKRMLKTTLILEVKISSYKAVNLWNAQHKPWQITRGWPFGGQSGNNSVFPHTYFAGFR